MKAETPGITNVFQRSTILTIPFFQRQYVWGKAMWDRFLVDMDSLVGTSSKYFLGSLILKEEKVKDEEAMWGVNTKYSVIDGQQRLTTLSLYLRALHSLVGDETTLNNFKATFFVQNNQNTPVLSHSLNDKAAYQEVMWGNRPDAYKNKSVVKAYHYLYEELCKKENKRELLMSVYAHIKFVTIILDDQDDEQQIFDTINSLGVDLTIDELMKNFLYEVDDEEDYRRNWMPAFDNTEVRTFWGTDDAARKQAATDENKTITNFFYDFVRIKMWEYRNKKGFDRKLFVQKNHIFSTCKAFVELFDAKKQDLANEIIEYSKLYHKYFDKNNLNKRIPKDSCIERVACIAMSSIPSITPYLLFILRKVSDLEERNKIFGYIEKYLVRRMVCFATDQNKYYAEFFGETLISNDLDSYKKLTDYIAKIDSMKNQRMPSDDEIRINLCGRTYGNDGMLPRLFFYLQETANNSSLTGGLTCFIAESILPRRTREADINYPPHIDNTLEQQRQTRIKSLGNYVLLRYPNDSNIVDKEIKKEKRKKFEQKIKKLTNEKWEEKSKFLVENTKDLVCFDWLKKRRTWGEIEIEERNKLLVEVVKKIWGL